MAFIMRTLGWLLYRFRAGETYMTCNMEWVKSKPKSITITSPDFKEGGAIPKKHLGPGIGDNVSPALNWDGVPAGARELVFFLEDPDVPLWRPGVHTVVTGISPMLKGLAQGALDAPKKGPEPSSVSPITLQKGMLGMVGYTGPRPPPCHGPHTYAFQLYALDTTLDLKAPAAYSDVQKAMEGHVMAWGRLDGIYEEK